MGPDPRPRPRWAKSSTRSRKIPSRPQPGKRAGRGHFTLGLGEKKRAIKKNTQPWGRASGRRGTKSTFNPSSPNASFWGVAGTEVSPPAGPATPHQTPKPESQSQARQPQTPTERAGRPGTHRAEKQPRPGQRPTRRPDDDKPTGTHTHTRTHPNETHERRRTHTHKHKQTHAHTHTQAAATHAGRQASRHEGTQAGKQARKHEARRHAGGQASTQARKGPQRPPERN